MTNEISDAVLLEAIRSGDDSALRRVYLRCREPCLRFLLGRVIYEQVPNRQELALELYTEAVIVMVENARADRLTELSARLETYLNAVARNLFYKRQRRQREDYRDPDELPPPLVEPQDDLEPDAVRRELYEKIRQLGPRCRQLLAHFYFLDLDWESVAEILGYKNAASAKNNKAKCMVRLRALYGMPKPTKASK